MSADEPIDLIKQHGVVKNCRRYLSYEVTSKLCPLQIEGRLNGKEFYFHARGSEVYCHIELKTKGLRKKKFCLNRILQEDSEALEGTFCCSQVVSEEMALEFIIKTYKLSLL